MNQIESYNARFPLPPDPRELASWVNQIEGYNARFSLPQDPRELASWVNQIESYKARFSLLQDPRGRVARAVTRRDSHRFRTCRFPATGSSDEGLASCESRIRWRGSSRSGYRCRVCVCLATFAIRRGCGYTVSNFWEFVVFPSNGPITVRPYRVPGPKHVFPSLHGVPTERVPPLLRYYGAVRLLTTSLCAPFPSRSDTTLDSLVRSGPSRTEGSGLELLTRYLHPGSWRGCDRSLTFLGNPCVPMLCSPTLVGPVDQALQPTDAAPSLKLGRGLTTLRISRLNRTASALAVYAS